MLERLDMTTFERIKLLADKQGKSLQKVASDLGFGDNYIYNLKGAKSPAADKLALIADYFHVSVDYLLGREENYNWELWQEVTGFSVKELKNEIRRMKSANHILGDENDIQNVIGQAVSNLSGIGETDRGIIAGIYQGIITLWSEASDRYKDPKKIEEVNTGGGKMKIIPANADVLYDDLSKEVHDEIYDILAKTRYALDDLKSKCKL